MCLKTEHLVFNENIKTISKLSLNMPCLTHEFKCETALLTHFIQSSGSVPIHVFTSLFFSTYAEYFPSVTLKRNTFSKDVFRNYIQVLYVDSETFFMADVFGIWRRMCKLITLKSNCALQLSYYHDAAVHADSLACLPATLDETEPLLMTFELLLLWQISKSLLLRKDTVLTLTSLFPHSKLDIFHRGTSTEPPHDVALTLWLHVGFWQPWRYHMDTRRPGHLGLRAFTPTHFWCQMVENNFLSFLASHEPPDLSYDPMKWTWPERLHNSKQ